MAAMQQTSGMNVYRGSPYFQQQASSVHPFNAGFNTFYPQQFYQRPAQFFRPNFYPQQQYVHVQQRIIPNAQPRNIPHPVYPPVHQGLIRGI